MRVSIMAVFVAGFLALGAFPACGGDQPSRNEAVIPAGTLRVSLTGVSSSGITYRLRSGDFSVNGPEDVEFSTEDDPDRRAIGVELAAGQYIIELADGWFLERETNGMFASVDAILTSPNPVGFVITEQGVTSVVFRFRAGDDVVDVGDGTLNVSIAVDDTTCGMESTRCADQCVNLTTDAFNCGACANVCPPAPGQMVGTCFNGACVPSCIPGQVECGGFCAEVGNDPFNCGMCGNICPPAPGQMAGTCFNGACIQGCVPGQVQCGGICADVRNDPFNCGACGLRCPPRPGQMSGICIAGVCR